MEAVVGRRAAALQADALRQEQEQRAQARAMAKSACRAIFQAGTGAASVSSAHSPSVVCWLGCFTVTSLPCG